MRKGVPSIRYVLDLWVYRHLHEPQPEWDAVLSRLGRDGICAPAKNLLDLSECLFGDGEATPLLGELASYVMGSPLYGEARRAYATEAALAWGRAGAFAHQLLRDRDDYANRYPWLDGRPWLPPAAWALRAAYTLRVHGGHIPAWLRGMRSVSDDEVREQRERLRRFGL